jgi:glucokinase
MALVALGIDLGGTRIKTIALAADGTILHQSILPTNDGDAESWQERVTNAVKALVLQFAAAHEIVIGVSAPGLANENNTAIAFMPGRLQGLEQLVWANVFNTPTWVLNDAVAALLAEHKMGAAQNAKHGVMLTLGTGVGGAILIDGKPYTGHFQKAGHIGHMAIHSLGEPGITGTPGSLEEAIGNCSIQKRSMGKYDSTQALLQDVAAAKPFAQWVWLQSVRSLALGIVSLSNLLSPQLIIIGGGIAEAGEALFTPLAAFMDVYEWRPAGNKVQIVQATQGEMAGAMGAALFALEHKQSNK